MFSGWYNNFYSNRASGQSDDDVLHATIEQWNNMNTRKSFKYMYVWKVMKELEKWAPQHAHKKSRTSESDDHASTGSEARSRPMGQQRAKRHGFPGMLGSLDCMYWEWRNCPVAWKGQYNRGDYGVPTIILEAVASIDLWIWHAFFYVQGNTPQVTFTVNGTSYRNGYYLTDGIYPGWASFVKSFSCPMDPKRKKFKERQEAARKDVERAFGVLQARWAIVRGPARYYYKEDLRNIIYTCIILHNMIIEDEGDTSINWSDEDTPPSGTINLGSTQEFQAYLHNFKELQYKDTHHQLRADLVEHIWANCESS